MNFKTHFYTLLEARQEEIDKIRNAVDKVEDRPFAELFEGKGDRFLIKVYNPRFEKAAKNLDLNINKFDFDKRTYDGQNINSFLKKLGQVFISKEKDTWKDPELNKMLDDLFGDADPTTQEILNTPILKRDKYKFTRNQNPELDIIGQLKQAIDQNNIYYYLMFSRHPVDVLRMSDHKGISSCHRLKGSYSKDSGQYSHCALADARNDGGIVYLIKGGDARRIKDHLDDQDVFEDKDRNISGIRPLGRIRLRRFIDLKTGDDWAVPTTLQDEQKYGTFTTEIFEIAETYVRKHQAITQNPPTPEYAAENIVMVGGSYSDESLADLLGNFFKKYNYKDIRHKSKHMTTWKEEIDKILDSPDLKTLKIYKITQASVVSGNKIDFRYEVNTVLPDLAVQKIKRLNKPLAFEKDVTTMVNQYFGENRFVVGISAQTVSSPPTWKEQDGKIEVNIKCRTRLFDPEEIRSLISDMFYVEKREQRAGNI